MGGTMSTTTKKRATTSPEEAASTSTTAGVNTSASAASNKRFRSAAVAELKQEEERPARLEPYHDAGLTAGHATSAASSSAASTTTANLLSAAPPVRDNKKPAQAASRSSSTKAAADFNNRLFELLHHKATSGTFVVHKDDNPDLHSWMGWLKKEYKAAGAAQQPDEEDEEAGPTPPGVSELTPSQVAVLSYLHVPLTSRGDGHWNRFYELLVQYKEDHGHVMVPRLCEIPGLGDWVTDQRRQYKTYKQGGTCPLTAERRDKMEALGFQWQIRNRPEWDHRFEQLLEFKIKHGDCKVPQHYKENKSLGKWVAKQREQYKLLQRGQHSFLTPYRLEKLNTAGFVWQLRTAMDNDDEDGGGNDSGTALLNTKSLQATSTITSTTAANSNTNKMTDKNSTTTMTEDATMEMV